MMDAHSGIGNTGRYNAKLAIDRRQRRGGKFNPDRAMGRFFDSLGPRFHDFCKHRRGAWQVKVEQQFISCALWAELFLRWVLIWTINTLEEPKYFFTVKITGFVAIHRVEILDEWTCRLIAFNTVVLIGISKSVSYTHLTLPTNREV